MISYHAKFQIQLPRNLPYNFRLIRLWSLYLSLYEENYTIIHPIIFSHAPAASSGPHVLALISPQPSSDDPNEDPEARIGVPVISRGLSPCRRPYRNVIRGCTGSYHRLLSRMMSVRVIGITERRSSRGISFLRYKADAPILRLGMGWADRTSSKILESREESKIAEETGKCKAART